VPSPTPTGAALAGTAPADDHGLDNEDELEAEHEDADDEVELEHAEHEDDATHEVDHEVEDG